MIGLNVLDSRKNMINIIYEGVNITENIEKSLLRCVYKEAQGTIDSFEMELEDIEGNWIGSWKPLKGDQITVEYINRNLVELGDIERVNSVGVFYVDTIEFTGQPSKVVIKSLSMPLDSNLKDMEKTKVWENIKLKKIVEEIAKESKLELFYHVDIEREYKREEQKSSDHEMLKKICQDNGLSMKIYKDRLVIYEDSKMEKEKPVIILNKNNLISYKFQTTDTRAYSECLITYFDHKLKSKISQRVALKERENYKGNPRRTLVINADKSLQGDTIEQKKSYLITIAKKALKEKNKFTTTAGIKLNGQPVWISCGEIIRFEDVGNFSGNYIVTSCDVDLSDYKVDLNLRKVNTDDMDSEEVFEDEE